ncbi:MAG: hypothetical protein ACU83U_10765 [Gammaproteobacteria bacterium]
MAFDIIIEVVVRTIAQFIVEVLFIGVFYWPGWVVLRILTLGHYPPPQSHPHNREFVAIVAFTALSAGVALHYS